MDPGHGSRHGGVGHPGARRLIPARPRVSLREPPPDAAGGRHPLPGQRSADPALLRGGARRASAGARRVGPDRVADRADRRRQLRAPAGARDAARGTDPPRTAGAGPRRRPAVQRVLPTPPLGPRAVATGVLTVRWWFLFFLGSGFAGLVYARVRHVHEIVLLVALCDR